ncbi:MAG: hypothetical protein U0934_04005 [Pseudotabrizicola sp.]|nr:hypothetical protein [Pseudotabrizicola sp.]MDO8884725.1 hypothetical protein [Pseudotabrizicola sp.]MDP2081164.1 hypothetical protein [Pseudotabrizicola sp.]MDZ7573107.1 hypothetical protein [Pseudotabrizicola sp.]
MHCSVADWHKGQIIYHSLTLICIAGGGHTFLMATLDELPAAFSE